MHKFKLLACVVMLATGTLTAQVQTDKLPAHFSQEKQMTDDPFVRKWELSVQGGWSYRLAKLSDQISPDFVDYGNKLKSGYHIGADLNYFWRENMGVGLQYSRFGSKGSMDNVTATDMATGEIIGQGEISDNIVINFIAPSFNYRYILPSRKAALQAHYALGYLSYNNNSKVINEDLKITAQSFGVSLGAHVIIPLGQRLSFIIGGTLVGGNFRKLKVKHANGTTQTIEAEKDNERENVSRIDLSAGLRFKL